MWHQTISLPRAPTYRGPALVTLKMCTKVLVGVILDFPLMLYDSRQNWNMSTNYSKTPYYKIL